MREQFATSRGLLQHLEVFDRSVRRLDGSQDGATDFANAREVLQGGVDKSIDAIDEAREVGLPLANLATVVDRCRVALSNYRDQLGLIPPLPVDESFAREDDAILSHASQHADDENDDVEHASQGSMHPSRIPLPGSSHGSVRDIAQARETLSCLSRARDEAAQRLSDLERRSSTGSSSPVGLSSAAHSMHRRACNDQSRTTQRRCPNEPHRDEQMSTGTMPLPPPPPSRELSESPERSTAPR